MKAKALLEVEAEVTAAVEKAAEEALTSRERMPKAETAFKGVYANDGRH